MWSFWNGFYLWRKNEENSGIGFLRKDILSYMQDPWWEEFLCPDGNGVYDNGIYNQSVEDSNCWCQIQREKRKKIIRGMSDRYKDDEEEFRKELVKWWDDLPDEKWKKVKISGKRGDLFFHLSVILRKIY